MSEPIYIIAGARTPMADYAGKLKDVPALELGAIAARAALREGVASAGSDSARRLWQRPADQRGCGVWRPACRAQGWSARQRPGADGQPAVRIGHRGRHSGGASDPSRRSGRGAHGRRGEHEPGAARDSRAAERPASRSGTAGRHAVVGAPRHALRLHDGRDRGELRREVRREPRGAGRVCDAQPAARGARLGGRPLRRRSGAGRTEDAQGNRALRPR